MFIKNEENYSEQVQKYNDNVQFLTKFLFFLGNPANNFQKNEIFTTKHNVYLFVKFFIEWEELVECP